MALLLLITIDKFIYLLCQSDVHTLRFWMMKAPSRGGNEEGISVVKGNCELCWPLGRIPTVEGAIMAKAEPRVERLTNRIIMTLSR